MRRCCVTGRVVACSVASVVEASHNCAFADVLEEMSDREWRVVCRVRSDGESKPGGLVDAILNRWASVESAPLGSPPRSETSRRRHITRHAIRADVVTTWHVLDFDVVTLEFVSETLHARAVSMWCVEEPFKGLVIGAHDDACAHGKVPPDLERVHEPHALLIANAITALFAAEAARPESENAMAVRVLLRVTLRQDSTGTSGRGHIDVDVERLGVVGPREGRGGGELILRNCESSFEAQAVHYVTRVRALALELVKRRENAVQTGEITVIETNHVPSSC